MKSGGYNRDNIFRSNASQMLELEKRMGGILFDVRNLVLFFLSEGITILICSILIHLLRVVLFTA